MTINVRDLKDQQIGGLTVLRISERRDHSSVMWWCLCQKCGEVSEHSSRKLVHQPHKVKSCGCGNGHPKGPGGRPAGAKDRKKRTRPSTGRKVRLKPKKEEKPACYGCQRKMQGVPIEREIDGQIRHICRDCNKKLDNVVVVKNQEGTYKKSQLSDWERGKQEAMLCGAGRLNFI